MMLVIVEFELAPGQEGEFENLLGEMQERVKQYDGYLGIYHDRLLFLDYTQRIQGPDVARGNGDILPGITR